MSNMFPTRVAYAAKEGPIDCQAGPLSGQDAIWKKITETAQTINGCTPEHIMGQWDVGILRNLTLFGPLAASLSHVSNNVLRAK